VIALWILAAGVAVRLGWLALGLLKLARYRRHGCPIPLPPEWTGAARNTELLLSDEVSGPVGQVGRLADQAIFAPHDPPDPETAGHAWALERVVRHRVRARLDRRQALVAFLRVGSHATRPVERHHDDDAQQSDASARSGG